MVLWNTEKGKFDVIWIKRLYACIFGRRKRLNGFSRKKFENVKRQLTFSAVSIPIAGKNWLSKLKGNELYRFFRFKLVNDRENKKKKKKKEKKNVETKIASRLTFAIYTLFPNNCILSIVILYFLFEN